MSHVYHPGAVINGYTLIRKLWKPTAIMWEVKSEWGEKRVVRQDNIRRIVEKRHIDTIVGFNQLYKSYQMAAIKRGCVWELSKEQMMEITSQNCTYCGKPPSQKQWVHEATC